MPGGCRSNQTISELFDSGTITGSSLVRRLPYISSFFGGRFNALGVNTLADLLSVFSAVPPLPATELSRRIAVLTQNPRRNQCVEDNDRLYHVSDSNQCLFNAILSFLRRCHNRRAQWQQLQFHGPINVPSAFAVPYRDRGHTSSRSCSCLAAADCQNDQLCRWHPENAEGGPVCVPRFGPGFEGVGSHAGQRVNSGSFEARTIDGMSYVRRWRQPSPPSNRPLRRPFPLPDIAGQQALVPLPAAPAAPPAVPLPPQPQPPPPPPPQPIARRTRSQRQPVARRTRAQAKKRRRINKRRLRRWFRH
jgi:hypothetical protein